MIEDIIKKLDSPVLTRHDVPYCSALTFNAGVAKFNGKYVMLFRNDYGDAEKERLDGTNIGFAQSDDGIKWTVAPNPCLEVHTDEIKRVYDPRITVIDGQCFVCMAVDTQHGLRGGIYKTDDFENFELISMSLPDNRNMVLFPEKIGGHYCRLDRPMSRYGRKRPDEFDIWFSSSPDLKFWGNHEVVLGAREVSFSNNKIGPAAPPVKTEKGWLTLFHAVDIDEERGKNGWEKKWQKRYRAGLMLLDLENPSKIIGRYENPVLWCDKEFEEKDGFRKDVIFPGGMILEDNGEVKIYYGASDTVECLAKADVNDLIRLCTEGR